MGLWVLMVANWGWWIGGWGGLWVSMVVGCGFWLMGFGIDFDINGF